MRCLLVLVGALTIGCAAAPSPAPRAVTSTPAERLRWLEAAAARADQITHAMRGAYVPRGSSGADMVCSVAIEIEAWYGVADERWEVTHATSTTMTHPRPALGIREELARIGVRDCVLDLDR